MLHLDRVTQQTTPEPAQGGDGKELKEAAEAVGMDVAAPAEPAVEPRHPGRTGGDRRSQPMRQEADQLLGPGVHVFGQLHRRVRAGIHLACDAGETARADLQVCYPDDIVICHGIREVLRRCSGEGIAMAEAAGRVVEPVQMGQPRKIRAAIVRILEVHGALEARQRNGLNGDRQFPDLLKGVIQAAVSKRSWQVATLPLLRQALSWQGILRHTRISRLEPHA